MLQLERRRLLRLAMAGITLPVLASCAPSPTPSPTVAPAKPTDKPAAATAAPAPTTAAKPVEVAKPTAAPVQRQIVKWKHATVPPQYGLVIQRMAGEKGFDKEEGVEIEYVTLNTDPTLTAALLSGEVDSADAGASNTIVGISKGQPVKILAAHLPLLTLDVLSKKDVGSIKDLEGKNVGISGVGALPHVVMLALFEKFGADPSKANFVSMAGANDVHVQALTAGTIDSGVASVEFRRVIEGNANLKVLANLGDELPQYVRTIFVALDKTINEKKEIVERVLRAYARGAQLAGTNRDEAVRFGVKITGQAPELMGWTFDIFKEKKWVHPKADLPLSYFEWMQDLNIKLKLQDTKADLSKAVDFSIAKKVAQDLKL